MNRFDFVNERYIIAIILLQVILLLVVFAGKRFGFFSNQFFINALDSILIIVVILALISLYFTQELFKLIDQKMKFKIQKAKLEEKEKMVESLRSHKHDFLNHLQMIYTMLQLNKKEQAKEYINSLNEDLNHLNCSNDKVLDSILDPVLIPKQKEAINQGIQLEYELEEGIKDIKNISINRISRILFNLIDNAISAIKDFKKEGKIKIVGKNKADKYIISVHNTGSFIGGDLIDKVLKPGVSTKGGDRGFGLYIIKSLIEDAGGRLEVKSSQKDFNTEFICYFIKKY